MSLVPGLPIFLVFWVLASLAAASGVHELATGPWRWFDPILLLGVLFAGLVWLASLAVIGTCLVRWILPGRIDGDCSELRLLLWSHDRPFAFGRIRSVFQRDEVVGVAMRCGQGGWALDTQLTLLHASGSSVSLGWSGPRFLAIRLAGRLARWLGRKIPAADRSM